LFGNTRAAAADQYWRGDVDLHYCENTSALLRVVVARKIFHRYFYGIARNNFLFSPAPGQIV
jgi:hypothetical protein